MSVRFVGLVSWPAYAEFCFGSVLSVHCQVLELAGNVARDHLTNKIQPWHMSLATAGDEELNRLLCDGAVLNEQALPHTQPQLLLTPPLGRRPDQKEVNACFTVRGVDASAACVRLLPVCLPMPRR